ncbi:MAG: phage portal protein [Vicinamibacterales bacterium]
MRLFGLEITRAKAAVEPLGLAEWNRGPWVSTIREAFAGAWQRGISYDKPALLKQSTVWSCVTLIVQDIGKLGVELIESKDGIWVPTTNSAYSPVLRKPNHFQGWIKFIESWVSSKMTRGNAFILKERDNRGAPGAGNVVGMYVLDPERVTVLVAPTGDVFYQLGADNLAGLPQAVVVPASEIIHDVGFAPYHPLCGLPPLTACALAAGQSLAIQESSARFFANNSRPGGILTAPAQISDETAKRIKEHWDANYAGAENYGKVAVLGNGLTYEAMAVNAVDSDLAKQLAWTDEKICGVYHVPPFMVGVGPQPSYDNIAKFTIQYYQQALQNPIECIEECLDLGLGLGSTLGIRLNIDNLIRMDQQSMMEALEKGKNYLKPNEGRQRLNLPPVPGGDAVYRQQQDFSLTALSKRDAKADPFAKQPNAPAPAASPTDDDDAKSLHFVAARLTAHHWATKCLQS